jgi:hypothetical protein
VIRFTNDDVNTLKLTIEGNTLKLVYEQKDSCMFNAQDLIIMTIERDMLIKSEYHLIHSYFLSIMIEKVQ